MKNFRTILLISILFCCNVFSAEQIRYDDEKIAPRSLPQSPSQVYTDREFVYNEPIKEPNFFERLWATIVRKFYEILNKIFNWNLQVDSLSGRNALWFLLTALLVILLVVGLIFGIKRFNRVMGRGDRMLINVDEVERNLAETDIDRLIETAVRERNYRLAVRFCYLKMLKNLAENQIIEYQYQKTNQEYAYEIQDDDLRARFLDLTFIFDYCWYGDHEATEEDYQKCVNMIICQNR